jgi:hypothetical protein
MRALRAEPQVQPIRVSLGKPRWIAPEQAERYPAIQLLMPLGLLGLDLDRAEFEARYIERLDRYAGPIEEALAATLERTSRPIAALCCFEDLRKPGQWCHRTMAARWIENRLGLQVPELGPTRRRDAPQMTLTDDQEGR